MISSRPDRVGKVNVNLASNKAFFKMYSTMSPISVQGGQGGNGEEAVVKSANMALHVGGITYVGSTTPTVHLVDLDAIAADDHDADATQQPSSSAITPVDMSHCPDFPEEIAQHSAVTIANRFVYLFGNYSERNWRVFRFDAATMTMEPLQLFGAPLPPNLHCHTSVAVEGGKHGPVIYTFGGAMFRDSCDQLYEFYVNSHEWYPVTPTTPHRPPKRLYHLSCAIGKYVYIYGGAPDVKSTTADDPVYDDMWRFDTETRQWEEVEQRGIIPTARGSGIFRYVAPYAYLIGGYDGKQALHDVHRFDPQTGYWCDVTELMSQQDEAEEEGMTWVGTGFHTNCQTPPTSPTIVSPTQEGLDFESPEDYPVKDDGLSRGAAGHDTHNTTGTTNPSSAILQPDDLGGRWASASCVVGSKLFVAGGFSALVDKPTEMDLCERMDVVEILPLTMKHMIARFVAASGFLDDKR